MINNYFLYLLVICAWFISVSVSREALLGGTLVRDTNRFAYQVSVLSNELIHRCGGAIISDRLVVTSARCVVKNNGEFYGLAYSVLAGAKNMNDIEPVAIIVKVRKIFVPVQFRDPITTPCDIAVLMLNHSLGLLHNRNLKALKLPNHNDRETYAGKIAVITGFGWNRYNMELDTGDSDGQLRFAEADVLSRDHRGYDLRAHDDSQICAKIKQPAYSKSAKPRGVCVGDSGGPLVYNGILIGVASIGQVEPSKCSEQISGAIYTRVSHYLKFIEQAMDYENNKHHGDVRTHELYH